MLEYQGFACLLDRFPYFEPQDRPAVVDAIRNFVANSALPSSEEMIKLAQQDPVAVHDLSKILADQYALQIDPSYNPNNPDKHELTYQRREKFINMTLGVGLDAMERALPVLEAML